MRRRAQSINLHHRINKLTQASGADFRQCRGANSNAWIVRHGMLDLTDSFKRIPQKLILVTVKANALAQLAPLPRAQLPRTPPLQLRHHAQPRTITVTMLSEAITMHKP